MASQPFDVYGPALGPAIPLLVHIPHAGLAVPAPWREQIVLDDAALERELVAMTDRYTDVLFDRPAVAEGVRIVNRVSRLVCDPERFPDDEEEGMAKVGMGVVYTQTADRQPLRRPGFPRHERERVRTAFFHPWAWAVEKHVEALLERFERCLILDGHSFPAVALPYELAVAPEAARVRPDLCLGFDPRHEPRGLVERMEALAHEAGWSVGHNTPFAGSYVPLRHYNRERRVRSLMIEVNRGRYMDEATGERSEGFPAAQALIDRLLVATVEWLQSA